MVDIYTIKPGTVFAWFMLVLVVRRIVVVVMLIVARTKQTSKSSSQRPVETRNGENDKKSAAQENDDFPTRVDGIITNDSENDTYFLILYLGTAIFSYSVNADVVRLIVYGSIYLTARILHCTMYALGFQPPRTIAYLIGLFCTFAMSLDLVITMSRSSN